MTAHEAGLHDPTSEPPQPRQRPCDVLDPHRGEWFAEAVHWVAETELVES